jgi:ankyrin repeat protein
VKLLLEKLQKQSDASGSSASLSATINHADSHGDTCLHLALQSQCQRVFNYNYPLTENHMQIAYDLVLAGADTSVKNAEGDTALDLIHPDLANFLECS